MHNSTRQKVLEQFGFGTWSNSQDIQSLQVKQADKENYSLIKNEIVSEPCEIDDHEVHINQHISFLLGNDFEKLGSPAQKEIMIKHIRKHKDLIKNIGE